MEEITSLQFMAQDAADALLVKGVQWKIEQQLAKGSEKGFSNWHEMPIECNMGKGCTTESLIDLAEAAINRGDFRSAMTYCAMLDARNTGE